MKDVLVTGVVGGALFTRVILSVVGVVAGNKWGLFVFTRIWAYSPVIFLFLLSDTSLRRVLAYGLGELSFLFSDSYRV